MLPSFLLTLRETLEAILIISIVLTTLHTTQRKHQQKYVWAGTAMAIMLSIIIAFGLFLLGTNLTGTAEEIFEGMMMLLAAIVLTWMIFWMQNQSSSFSQNLRKEVDKSDRNRGGFALFSLAFLAVFREGFELSIFLTATALSNGQSDMVGGFMGGLVLALLLGWTMTNGLLRLDIRRFFLLTSILLILVAGGLIAHGVHELNEAGWIPSIIEHVWDINPWFDETSFLGQMMTALFGYNANPSLSEVIISSIYYGSLFLVLIRRNQKSKTHPIRPISQE